MFCWVVGKQCKAHYCHLLNRKVDHDNLLTKMIQILVINQVSIKKIKMLFSSVIYSSWWINVYFYSQSQFTYSAFPAGHCSVSHCVSSIAFLKNLRHILVSNIHCNEIRSSDQTLSWYFINDVCLSRQCYAHAAAILIRLQQCQVLPFVHIVCIFIHWHDISALCELAHLASCMFAYS